MSSAPQAPRDDDDRPTGRSTEAGRRRARVLIPAVIVGVVLVLILFMVLVSQLNQ
jgi:hypothetical protein